MSTNNFKIQTEKWKWADTVKSPGVYRDEEFVITKSKEEALESNKFLLNQPKGLTYTITVKRNDKYFTYFRHSMPCLGGLVKYRDSHGEKHFMNPYFPRDIRVAFPEGEITYIGCCRTDTKNIFNGPNAAYNEFIFSEESPWKEAFGTKDSIIFNDSSFILTNMNTDPTVFYSLMRLGGLAGGYYSGTGDKSKISPKVNILISATHSADPRRLAGQKPIRTSGGKWSENFGYTRGYNESIFKTSIPVKSLKDFNELPTTGYPPSFNFQNTYFTTTMKKEFGVDVTQLNQKTYEALEIAWEFFKKESKGLGSGFAD